MAGLVQGPTSRRDRSSGSGAARPAAGLLALSTAAALLVLLVTPAQPGSSRLADAADPDPFFTVMQGLAFENGKVLVVSAAGIVTDEDLFGDVAGSDAGVNDITRGGYAFFPDGAGDLLAMRPCGSPGVACPSTGSPDEVFDGPTYAFYQRQGAPLEEVDPAMRVEVGPILALTQYPPAPIGAGDPFSGGTHAIITRLQGTTSDVLYFAYTNGAWQMFKTDARTVWIGNDVVTFVAQAKNLLTMPTSWDVYGYASDGTPAGTGRDTIRGLGGEPMLAWEEPATVVVEDAPDTTTTTSTTTDTSTSTTSSSTTSSTTQTTSSATSSTTGSTGGGGEIPWGLVALGGIGLAILGGVLILRGRGGGGTSGGGTITGSGGIPVGGAAGGDPCPPLIAAAEAARAACEEAKRAAEAAADTVEARAAEVETARLELENARKAREAAEKELERRQKPPDRGGDSASTTQGGRTVTEDSYELHLLEEARAAANAAWEAARAAATTDAERQAANDAWQEELGRLDGPDGIDEIRRRDTEGRAKWVKEAEEALEAAREAESAARAALDRAVEAAKAAQEAADAARNAADEACARADAAEQAAVDAGCMTPAGDVRPPRPPEPEPPAPPEPPPPPPTPPSPPTPPMPPPTPPSKPRKPRACPDDAEPRTREENVVEVDLFLISESRLKIDSNYPYGDDVDEALDDLDQRLAVTGAIGGMPDAIQSPVVSILGSLKIPSFDTITSKPAEAAVNAVRRLKERMEKFRRTGTWSLSVPVQHYRFYCRITEECVEGQWVETKREFVGDRIGSPRWVESPPFEVQSVAYDSERAWRTMTANYVRDNARAEARIAEAAAACGA